MTVKYKKNGLHHQAHAVRNCPTLHIAQRGQGEIMRKLASRLLVCSTLIAATTAVTLSTQRAEAFCGFYVAGSNAQMFNDATQVVLMRQGTRTVLSMQNHYEGPLEAFAMVVPVPTVLKDGDVKTLPNEVFAKVETMGAPRLVEYWEQDPCYVEPPMADMAVARSAAGGGEIMPAPTGASHGVKIEAKFTVGEYNILILSAKDSTGLETWLRQEKYSIPSGAADLLKPYVTAGMKFFVAKVDPTKVKFDGNKAMLSPLRFHYDTDEFALPIRLGLANSQGTQDLIVNILAPAKRYEVANYKNVTIPTNIDVKPTVRDRFGEFYAALYDATIAKNPGAVVTEYAWQAMGCDPCPGPMLDGNDLQRSAVMCSLAPRTSMIVLARRWAAWCSLGCTHVMAKTSKTTWFSKRPTPLLVAANFCATVPSSKKARARIRTTTSKAVMLFGIRGKVRLPVRSRSVAAGVDRGKAFGPSLPMVARRPQPTWHSHRVVRWPCQPWLRRMSRKLRSRPMAVQR